MVFGKIAQAVGSVLDPVRKLVDDVTTSKEEKMQLQQRLNEIENEAQQQMYDHVQEITNAQKEVLLAELQGNWLQRSWRPLLMYVFILILFNNFIVAPYVEAFATGAEVYLEFPTLFWQVMLLSIGGYIGGRTYEKVKGKADEDATRAQSAVDKMLSGVKLDPIEPQTTDNQDG